MSDNNIKNSAQGEREVVYIIHPDIQVKKGQVNHCSYSLKSSIEELEGLARSISLDIVDTVVIKVSNIQSSSFLGKGQREKISSALKDIEPDIVIFNHTLSPVQQRNLEREWGVKVIDRTGLILEIFGARAQTKEGRLQVELAALEYQRSRLVRSWTHLERQRGGAGFMGGPGERQIEIDRRLIATRITSLKKQLESVRQMRNLGRKSRERVPFPVIALVGYTNAGKSTLFNLLTNSNVFAEDIPFATLDPTLRRLSLPNNQEVILSDTVGFISELPTHLVASFRATLEQISYADVIIHVIDASHADYLAQKQDVISVLSDLGIDYEQDCRIVEVLNKIDIIDSEDISKFKRNSESFNNRVLLSAINGDGIEELLDICSKILDKNRLDARFSINIADGKALAWLYEHSKVLSRDDFEDHIEIHVIINPADLGKFSDYYGYNPK